MEIAQLPNQKRKNLLLIAILAIGLPLLVFAAYQVAQLITKAGSDNKPNNVVISNITTSSITISWTTESQVTGSIIPVENGNSKSPVTDKRGNTKRYTHYVELTNLEPSTSYSFTIVSGSDQYSDEDGKKFAFKTAAISADTPTPNPIYGTVDGGSGDDVILYAVLKDKSAYPVSATMPSGGNWIMDLSALRSISDKKIVVANSNSNIVLIAVGGTNKGSVVSGIYSDIFDSNGKLKDTNSLSLESKTDMYSNIPGDAIITAYSSTTTPTKEETETPTTPVKEEEEEVVEEEEENFTRKFRIVQQLEWIDMVSGSSTLVSGKTGAESIQVVNLTDTGFTVIWVSESKEQGTVKYGTAKDALSNTVVDQRDGLTTKGSYYVHMVDISRIQPDTTYYYEVVSGSNTYDNNGAKYSLKTYSTLSSPPAYESVTGAISTLPEHGEVIVLAYIKDIDGSGSSGNSTKMATLVDENGKWILSIGDGRLADGSAYYEYTSGDSFQIDFVTTFLAKSSTESMEGISSKDISIALASTSSTSSSTTTVSSLKNYGILGASDGTYLSSYSSTSTSSTNVTTGSKTPQTGVLDNMIYLLILAFVLCIGGYFLYSSSNSKSKKSNKMVKNI